MRREQDPEWVQTNHISQYLKKSQEEKSIRDLKTIDSLSADLAEMGSLSYKNKNFKYLLCIIDVFTKYACLKPLIEKRVKQLLMLFSK